jgi:polysaccharide biosynthesis protein PslL
VRIWVIYDYQNRMSTPMKSPRIEWIDILKGLGIILVVGGHSLTGLTSSIIYTFHMPLFFMIGGLLYRPAADYTAFLKRKATHLLVPYLTFLGIFHAESLTGAIVYALNSPSLGSVKGIFVNILQGLYGGELLRGSTSTFWFVTCFFVTQQVFNYLCNRFSPTHRLWILAASAGVSYIDAYYFKHLIFPGSINVMFAALPYFGLGYYLQGCHFKRLLYPIAGLICVLASWWLGQGYPLSLNMKMGEYGIPGLSFVVATAAIMLSIGLAKLLTSIGRLKQLLTYIGSASMVILYVHQFAQIQVQIHVSADAYWLRFAVGLLVPLAVYQLLLQYPLSRAVCLGSVSDFHALFPARTKMT